MADESGDNMEQGLPARGGDADVTPDAPGDVQPDAQKVPESSGATPETTDDAPPDLHAAEGAMDSVEKAAGAVRDAAAAPMAVPDLEPSTVSGRDAAAMSLLDDVALNVKIELGRTRMFVEDVLRLNADSVIELDKAAGDPVDIYVNNRHVARGEVLVLNENFCVRVSEILDAGQTPEEAPTETSD
ncbi:MAG: flagellar motor switch protein FliN [Planctomycetota bacterium]